MILIPNSRKRDEWFYDAYTDSAGLAIKVKKGLVDVRTKFQRVRIIDTFEFGKILILNNYMYQAEYGTELTEMLVHVPFNVGSVKKKVLLIGGGDGVSLVQLVKYKDLKEIHVVDIDEELTNTCKEHFFVPKKTCNGVKLFFSTQIIVTT